MSTYRNLLSKTGSHINFPNAIILDASVAVKWWFEEEGTGVATEILRRIRRGEVSCFVPEIIAYEVANALWKGKRSSKNNILLALEELFDSGIEIVRINQSLATITTGLMVEYDLSFYDAMYASLAKKLKLPLLTANIKHHVKVKGIKTLGL